MCAESTTPVGGLQSDGMPSGEMVGYLSLSFKPSKHFMHNTCLMRDEKERRKKQARSNKQQQGKATQHTQGSHFSEEKLAASGGTQTHDTLHSRQSTCTPYVL